LIIPHKSGIIVKVRLDLKKRLRAQVEKEIKGQPMKYHFKVHKEKNGFWAECLELGCVTQADSKAELLHNMQEALDLYLSEPEASTLLFAEPKNILKGRNIVAVQVSPSVAFAMELRQTRLKRRMTQKAMMELLGIRNLSNYQRLEDPERANPELKTLFELQEKLPELSVTRIFG
jgi:antitoxin HicB